MYCVTGVGLAVTKYVANDGKKARWNRDVWDKVGLALISLQWPFFDANNSTAKYV
jgi:NADH-ubiquinone oxidoreductase MWFE subunit